MKTSIQFAAWVLAAAFTIPTAFSQDELEGKLVCQGYLGSVSLNTTLILERLNTPRNPRSPDFFGVQLSLDDSAYARDTFTEGAGIQTPMSQPMDYFSCSKKTYDPNMALSCGGYMRAPNRIEGDRVILNPTGISVNVRYWVNGAITAQAITSKKDWTTDDDLGRQTVYRCKRVR